MGHAGAIGGMYVICIWGVTQMGWFIRLVITQETHLFQIGLRMRGTFSIYSLFLVSTSFQRGTIELHTPSCFKR